MRAEVVIVGAGIAGASAAAHLTLAGVRDVVILEREEAPAAHASGKNAGLIRRLETDPYVASLTLEGARFLLSPPRAVADGPLAARTGSLLLASPAQADALAPSLERTGARALTAAEARRLRPEIAGAIDAAFLTADDALAEPREVVRALLACAERGGARILTGVDAQALALSSGAVIGLDTTAGRIDAHHVLDAAGPWAGTLAHRAGVEAPPLSPLRRHVFEGAPGSAALLGAGAAPNQPAGPWLWDLAQGLYVRTSASAVHVSGCDESPHPAGPVVVDPEEAARVRRKLAARLPTLASMPFEGARACLRTYASDGRPVVGPSAKIPGLHYAAGLAGYGLTAAAPVGALAALSILRPDEIPAPFRADRFREG